MTFRRVLALLAVALLVISLAGCGDETANPGTETTVEAAENTPQPAPEALLQAISSSEEQGVGMKPVRGMIVRSKDFEKMYFVAMEFSATGVDNQVGVWATNESAGTGMIMAVDGTAQAFTVWPAGDKTDANVSMSDDGAQEAKDAL